MQSLITPAKRVRDADKDKQVKGSRDGEVFFKTRYELISAVEALKNVPCFECGALLLKQDK